MQLGMIWAQDLDGVIGDGHSMLWRVPADFKHFRTSTMGCPIIMGRKSWEALGGPLPGRTHLVITRNQDMCACNCAIFHSLEDALEACKDAELAWIVGGGEIYRQAMQYADFLSVTELDLHASERASTPDSLVYAPEIDQTYWQLDSEKTDTDWRPQSGDARWRIKHYLKRSS